MNPVAPHPNFIILLVNNATESAAFYSRLLDTPILESSPNFAMLALKSGMQLGLWSKHTAQPASTAAAGAMELAFAVDSVETVHQTHAAWTAQGVPTLQAPVQMDFGFTFVGTDPDGHRLRVFAPTVGP